MKFDLGIPIHDQKLTFNRFLPKKILGLFCILSDSLSNLLRSLKGIDHVM